MHCISLNLGEFLRTTFCKCIVPSKVRIVFSGFKTTVYSSTSRMEKKEENIYAESLLLLRAFRGRSRQEADALRSNRRGGHTPAYLEGFLYTLSF